MTSSRTRPLSITSIATLAGFAAIFYVTIGVILVLALDFSTLSESSPAMLTTPSPFELVAGMCCIAMGFVYIWIVRALLEKSQIAYVLIQTLVTINILFSIFRMPLGLIPIALNLTALYFLRTKSAQAWLFGE